MGGSNNTFAGNSVLTGCIQDIICSGTATLTLGANCKSSCTQPLTSCSIGCTADVCNCPYTNVTLCTPYTTCPTSDSVQGGIIAAAVCSSVGAVAITVGLFFVNRKYRCVKIGGYGKFDEK